MAEGIYDVIMIGAGAVGCAIARELSRFEIRTLVLEKECDVAYGISGRMSGVVHSGFNNKPGTLMAKLCVEGNRGFETVCKELDIPYRKTGKVLVAFDDQDIKALERMIAQGIENGCEGLTMIDADDIRAIAPRIRGIGGMLSANTAIFDPFEYCIAHAENAMVNGVDFSFESKVTAIEKQDDIFIVQTVKDKFRGMYIINSAGMYCDKISAMLGIDQYKIYPCRGQYYILDNVADKLLDIPAYPVPKPGIGGLGIHITPTIEGNLILGPSAEYLEEPDDHGTTSRVMERLLKEAKELLPSIDQKYIIGNYSGIRPKQAPSGEGGFRDFVIKEEEECPGFINLIGIESPGFTASVPIARMVRDILAQHVELKEKKSFRPVRKGPIRFRDLSLEEQERLIEQDSEYGEIVCRCRNVTKREIKDAIQNMFGSRSLSSIKYRAWCMTGRCNGGYCMTKIVDILIHEYGMKAQEIAYRGMDSEMFVGEVKG